MILSLKCGRCGKVYNVDESMAGQPVQCARCRFIMVVPRAKQEEAQGAADHAPQREAVDLDAGAEMENSASAEEVSQVVLRRRHWPRWGRPKLEIDEKGDPRPRARGNLLLIGIALLPAAIGALCIYWFVPWSSLFGGMKNASPEAAASTGSNSVTSPVTPIAPEPAAPAAVAPAPEVTPSTSAATNPVSDWKQPVAPTAPAWLPDSKIADAFGPYIPVGGFALRGPTAGFHLASATSASLTWVGRGEKGQRAELTFTVMPSADRAQKRRRFPPDESPDLGRIGPDALGATRVDALQTTTESIPGRQIEYDTYDRGRHATIQISVSSNDKAGSLEILTACAMTLRRARTGEKSWTSSGDTLPPGYDPASRPEDWSLIGDPATSLQPVKHGFAYTIRPPTELRLVGSGVWGGHDTRIPAIDPDAGLPLLLISPRSLEQSSFRTLRAWADDQFARFGREAEWGTIDGVPFARTRYSDASTGRPAVCAVYAAVFNQKFWTLTTASWGSSPELELAVRSFKFARGSNPASAENPKSQVPKPK